MAASALERRGLRPGCRAAEAADGQQPQQASASSHAARAAPRVVTPPERVERAAARCRGTRLLASPSPAPRGRPRAPPAAAPAPPGCRRAGPRTAPRRPRAAWRSSSLQRLVVGLLVEQHAGEAQARELAQFLRVARARPPTAAAPARSSGRRGRSGSARPSSAPSDGVQRARVAARSACRLRRAPPWRRSPAPPWRARRTTRSPPAPACAWYQRQPCQPASGRSRPPRPRAAIRRAVLLPPAP